MYEYHKHHTAAHSTHVPIFSVLYMLKLSRSHLLWHIHQAASTHRISDVKGMIFARIGRVASSIHYEGVGVPSGGLDYWDEGGVEIPRYAPARTIYKGRRVYSKGTARL